MAQIAWVDALLREWAQWLVIGNASGYSSMSPLHPEWTPPSAGTTPTLKVAPSNAAATTHAMIGSLSARLQETIHVRYCMQLSVADQAERLECQPATIDQRVWRAHAELARLLGDCDT